MQPHSVATASQGWDGGWGDTSAAHGAGGDLEHGGTGTTQGTACALSTSFQPASGVCEGPDCPSLATSPGCRCVVPACPCPGPMALQWWAVTRMAWSPAVWLQPHLWVSREVSSNRDSRQTPKPSLAPHTCLFHLLSTLFHHPDGGPGLGESRVSQGPSSLLLSLRWLVRSHRGAAGSRLEKQWG